MNRTSLFKNFFIVGILMGLEVDSFAGEEVTIQKLIASDDWDTVSVTDSDDPFFISTKKPIGIPKNKEGYDGYVTLMFEYDKDGSFRLPFGKEQELFVGWTKSLKKKFSRNPYGFLLTVMASNGLCQWIVLTQDPIKAMEQIGAATKESPATQEYYGARGYANVVSQVYDPEWKNIALYLNAFSKK